MLGIWGGIGIAGLVLYYGARMPSASSWSIPERPPNVKIVSVNGSVLANRGTTGGEALALEDMSPYIPQAVMAIEDRRFYSHFGVDPLGLGRAIVTNVLTGRTVQGGSTLTQQLAKNLFLSPDRTLERKVQEVLLSFWLEHKFTKDQILAMYLNRVYFGSNAYGVEAASRRYFNKSARDVNLGEAAMLAGLLKAPSRLSPARDPQAAEERAQVVLQSMRDVGFITDDEIKTAMSQPPTKAKRFWSGAEHYAADMVLEEVRGLVGEVKQDIVVDTTIDPDLERDAEKALTHVLQGDGKNRAHPRRHWFPSMVRARSGPWWAVRIMPKASLTAPPRQNGNPARHSSPSSTSPLSNPGSRPIPFVMMGLFVSATGPRKIMRRNFAAK